MKNKILTIFILGIFLFSLTFASAGLLDNKKSIDNSNKYGYKDIEIKSLFGKVKFSGEITEHTESCGVDCFSTMEIYTSGDDALIDDVIFKTLQPDNSWIEQDVRSYQFQYWGLIDDYGLNCINKTHSNNSIYQECSQVKSGSHYGWINYNTGTKLSEGTYTIKLEGKKKPSRTVDWIIETSGKVLDEWAIWGNISLGDDAEVILNSPADDSISYVNEVQFNASANVTGGAYLTNMSLWTNESGSWSQYNVTNIPIGGLPYSSGISPYNNGNLTSYYKLDNTLEDSKNSYDLVNTNATYTSQGIINGAYDLERDNVAYMTTPNMLDVSLSNSICWWQKMETVGTSFIIGRINTTTVGGEANWYIFINSSGTGMGYCSGSSLCPTTDAPITADTEWHFYCATYNGTAKKIYEDGLNVWNYTQTTDDDGLSAFYLGRYGAYTSNSFDGTFDEFSFWNGALTDSEITELYGTNQTLLTQTWNRTITDDIIWNVQACDSDGDCGFATSNYSLSIDATAPTVNILYPTGTINYGKNGTSTQLNYSISDSNLDKCWYSYNEINTTISNCALNTTFTQLSGLNSITLWANDTVGNIASDTNTWNYSIYENSLTYTATVIEGSSQVFTLNITQGDLQISTVDLIYASTIYSMTTTRTNSFVQGTYTLDIPSVSADANKTFLFQITLSDSSAFNSSSNNQTVINLGIDNCASYTNKLLNLTLLDERLQTNITLTENTTIEVDLSLNTLTTGAEITNLSASYSNINPVQICINNNFTGNSLYLNGVIKYFSGSHATEYYNFQKEVLNSTTLHKNITLYDLLTTENTPFQVKITGSDALPLENALIELYRQYVSDGEFKIVEIPKTDTDGKAVLNIVEKSIIYNILIKKDGVLLKTLNNVGAFCEDVVVGNCKINIQVETEREKVFDYDNYFNFDYTKTYDTSTRVFTLDFDIINNTNHNITLKVYSDKGNSLTQLCDTSLLSSSGLLTCTIPSTSSNYLYLEIYYDSTILITDRFNIGDTDIYGANKFFILLVLILTLIGMFSFNKTGMIIAGIIGFIFAGFLSLFKGGALGIGSSMIWLVIVGIILIWKLNSKGGEN